MKRNLFNLSVRTSQIKQNHIRIAIAVGSLVLFALGAGAQGGFTDF